MSIVGPSPGAVAHLALILKLIRKQQLGDLLLAQGGHLGTVAPPSITSRNSFLSPPLESMEITAEGSSEGMPEVLQRRPSRVSFSLPVR